MAHPADKLALRWKNEGEKARQVLKQFKKRAPKNLDEQFEKAHDEVFEKINCLDCGNCCRTTSPMLFEKDIDRLAKHLRIKPRDFVKDYLFLDTDGIYAFRQTPCPFLGEDNACSVYEERPKACREYPHTNMRKMHTLLGLAEKNASICPAVLEILKKLAV
jgi:Fe-S-cluster containining protein